MIASDRGFLVLMVLLPAVLGGVSVLVPTDFGLQAGPNGKRNSNAGTITLILVVGMCFAGAANSVRELIKERVIYERERAVGLSRVYAGRSARNARTSAAERSGALRPGGTIVEGTSGNTGVGLAIAAAMRGYKCVFTMPDKMSQEKVRLLKAFGAEVIITPTAVPPDHPDYYVQAAKRIASETPGAILANQFYNPVNPEAHYRTTGPEIWEQTGGRITHFVASAGTGGTMSQIRRIATHRDEMILEDRRKNSEAAADAMLTDMSQQAAE